MDPVVMKMTDTPLVTMTVVVTVIIVLVILGTNTHPHLLVELTVTPALGEKTGILPVERTVVATTIGMVEEMVPTHPGVPGAPLLKKGLQWLPPAEGNTTGTKLEAAEIVKPILGDKLQILPGSCPRTRIEA